MEEERWGGGGGRFHTIQTGILALIVVGFPAHIE